MADGTPNSEANRDAAEQWAERGATALHNGDFDRAVQCLQRSLKLFEDERVATLLARAQAAAAGGGSGGGDSPQSPSPSPTSGSGGSSSSAGGDGVRHRRPAPGASPAPAAAAPPAEAPQRPYTKEQHAEATAILTAVDYYAVLSLERSASVDDIKKAYKKKALRLHPDKNAAPNAPDAFKRLSAAAAVLSDPAKRQVYDINGEEEAATAASRRAGGGGVRRGGGGFHGDGAHPGFAEWEAGIDPDDIFRMFFGMPPMGGGMGGGGGGRMYRDPQGRVFFVNGGGFGQPRRAQQRGGAAADDPAEAGKARLVQLMQLLPLLLMLLFSLTSGLGGGGSGRDAPYTFVPDVATGHTHAYETQPGLMGVTPGVPYYVRDGSEVARRLALPGPPGAAFRRQLEQQIDGEAQHFWARRCHDDRQNLAARQRFARDAATRTALEAQAQALAQSGSCGTYARLFKAPRAGGGA